MSRIDILLTTRTYCKLFEKYRRVCEGCVWDNGSTCKIPLGSFVSVKEALKCLD